ncbi:MAG: hypothetical protein JWQ12_668 [Glaciihabitans sp.]|nr:hypothetical protein [Glaciihabitans sp.]
MTHAGKEADEARVEALNADPVAPAADLLAQRLAFKRADSEADRIIAAEAYDGLGGVVSWDELEDLADTPWLLPDLIAFGETALLVAKRNVGKSMLAMALGFSIAGGLDSFLGRRIRSGKVMFILGEGSRAS